MPGRLHLLTLRQSMRVALSNLARSAQLLFFRAEIWIFESGVSPYDFLYDAGGQLKGGN